MLHSQLRINVPWWLPPHMDFLILHQPLPLRISAQTLSSSIASTLLKMRMERHVVRKPIQILGAPLPHVYPLLLASTSQCTPHSSFHLRPRWFHADSWACIHFPESVSLPERNKGHPVRTSSPLKLFWFWCRYTIGTIRGTEPYYPLQVSCIASFRKLKASLWAAITYSMENTSISTSVFHGHLAA